MKIVTAVLATTLLISGPASAQLTDRACSLISTLAETIMERRQNGDPMRDVLNSMASAKDTMPKEYSIARKMVVNAYQREKWNSQAAKQREVTEFGNNWASVCFQMIEEQE